VEQQTRDTNRTVPLYFLWKSAEPVSWALEVYADCWVPC